MKIDGIEFPVYARHGFKDEGTFQALYAARKWAISAGYSYGSLCRNEPVALFEGDHNIAKWKNLYKEDKKAMDGVILSSDFREGPVEIVIFNKPKI